MLDRSDLSDGSFGNRRREFFGTRWLYLMLSDSLTVVNSSACISNKSVEHKAFLELLVEFSVLRSCSQTHCQLFTDTASCSQTRCQLFTDTLPDIHRHCQLFIDTLPAVHIFATD